MKKFFSKPIWQLLFLSVFTIGIFYSNCSQNPFIKNNSDDGKVTPQEQTSDPEQESAPPVETFSAGPNVTSYNVSSQTRHLNRVDFLFVIDNSLNMVEAQKKLADQFDNILLGVAGLDWQMMFTSADMIKDTVQLHSSCTESSFAFGPSNLTANTITQPFGTKGALLPISPPDNTTQMNDAYMSNANYVLRTSLGYSIEQLKTSYKRTMSSFGSCGTQIGSSLTALNSSLSQSLSRLRSDALLAIIVLTKGYELNSTQVFNVSNPVYQPNTYANTVYNNIVSLLSGTPNKVVTAHMLVDLMSSQSKCSAGEISVGCLFANFPQVFRSSYTNADYTRFIRTMSDDILKKSDYVFLNCQPQTDENGFPQVEIRNAQNQVVDEGYNLFNTNTLSPVRAKLQTLNPLPQGQYTIHYSCP